MTDVLFDKEAGKQSFLELARTKPALKGIADGQFMDMLSTHILLLAEAATFNAIRLFQESYLATSVNRTSVLAGSYDRNYIPRKANPSSGAIRIVNNAAESKSVPARLVLMSEDVFPYELDTPAVIPAGQNILVSATQISRETVEITVAESSPYMEILLEPEKSRKVHDIAVFVDGVEWKKTRLFRNTDDESTVWAEIYTPLDQLGVRFGNGIFGRIPAIGSVITLELILTEGDITLLNEQQLNPVDSTGAFSGLEFISGTVMNGGSDMESTEETRRNALYYFLYDENHEWADDYAFMLRQKFPGLLFIKVWGEAEQEQMVGYRAEAHINHIFFSAYAPSDPDIGSSALEELQKIPEYNRYFDLVPVAHQKFMFNIEGKISRGLVLHEIQTKIIDLITQYYGQDSYDRFKTFWWETEDGGGKPVREKVLVRDFYRMLNRLTHNGIPVFETRDDVLVALSGVKEPTKLYDMVSVDVDSSVLALSYA